MAKSSTYKNEKRTGTVADFVSEAFGELQSLGEEMRSWAESMEEKFSQTQKYETVSSTADTLEGFDSEPEIDDEVGGLETTTMMQVKYGKERGSESRSTRAGNTEGLLTAAIEAIESHISELESKAEELDSLTLDEAKEAYEATPSEETGSIWYAVATNKTIPQKEIDAIKATVKAAFPNVDLEINKEEAMRDQVTAAEELRDTLQEVVDELGGLEFPGMYG